MRLSFVYAPYRHKRFSENLEVVDEDFGLLPPINLAWAAAIAEKAGHHVQLIDARAEGLSLSKVLQCLRSFGTEAAGFYFSTYMFHDTLAWARAVREALKVPILAGGVNLSLYPRETLATGVVDYGVSGLAVDALPALLDALERDRDPAGIPGVVWRRGDEIGLAPPRVDRGAFARHPFPARHLLPNDRYYSITSQRRHFTVMLTSTGCPQHCSFCPIAHIPYRVRPVDQVLAEVEQCVHGLGIREIDFFDADLAASRGRLRDLCDGLRDRRLDLEWSCRSCIDSLDRPTLARMAEAGCRKVYLGIETPDDMLLQKMQKRLDTSRVQEVIRAAQEVGIRPLGFFMTGVPGETRRTILRTIRYALSLGLDYAQFSRTIAKPGTDLHRQVCQMTRSDPWREWVLGSRAEDRLPTPWTDLSAREVEAWTKAAYLAFYFRPGYLGHAVARFRSPDEAIRSARTAARMILHAWKREA